MKEALTSNLIYSPALLVLSLKKSSMAAVSFSINATEASDAHVLRNLILC